MVKSVIGGEEREQSIYRERGKVVITFKWKRVRLCIVYLGAFLDTPIIVSLSRQMI